MHVDEILRSARGVWITRATPGADATAARVAKLGFSPIVAPLLQFSPMEACLELQRDEVLAFTSINGVTRAAAMTARRDMPVFAVGDATAAAARAAGFSEVMSAAGDVEALAALIVQARPQRLLHPSARQTAGDLVGTLRAAGIAARTVAVYETLEARALPAPVEAALSDRRLWAVLLHSPKAAQVAAALIGDRGEALRTVWALGLSSACIQPLEALGVRARIASSPTEDALLDVLQELAFKEPDGGG